MLLPHKDETAKAVIHITMFNSFQVFSFAWKIWPAKSNPMMGKLWAAPVMHLNTLRLSHGDTNLSETLWPFQQNSKSNFATGGESPFSWPLSQYIEHLYNIWTCLWASPKFREWGVRGLSYVNSWCLIATSALWVRSSPVTLCNNNSAKWTQSRLLPEVWSLTVPYSLRHVQELHTHSLKYSGSTTHVFVLVAFKRIWSCSDSLYASYVLLFPCRLGPRFGVGWLKLHAGRLSGRTKSTLPVLFVGRVVLLVLDCELRQRFRILKQSFAMHCPLGWQVSSSERVRSIGPKMHFF